MTDQLKTANQNDDRFIDRKEVKKVKDTVINKVLIPSIVILAMVVTITFVGIGLTRPVQLFPAPFTLLNGTERQEGKLPIVAPLQPVYKAGDRVEFEVEFSTNYNTDAWFTYGFYDSENALKFLNQNPTYLILLDNRDARLTTSRIPIPENFVDGDYSLVVSVSNALTNPFRYRVPFRIENDPTPEASE